MKNKVALFVVLIGIICQMTCYSWAGQMVVDRNMVNVRQKPTTKSSIVARLNKGHIVEELQKQGRWFEIDLLEENHLRGWIFETLLKPYDDQGTKVAQVLARMAGVVLYAEEMSSVLELLGSDIQDNLRKNPEVLQRVIREELVRKVIIKAAMDGGFDKEPLVARLMERSRTQALADHFLNQLSRPRDNFPSEEDVTAFYIKNLAEYTSPEKLHIGQLFIAVPMGVDKDTALKLAAKAKELAELAGPDGEDFSDIAKKFSEHKPTADKGGDIGWVEKKSLLPEVRDVLSEMSVGSVSTPLRSNQGWHIFKLLERQEEAVRPLSSVNGEIRDKLRRTQLEENRKNYIKNLIEHQPVMIDKDVFEDQFSNISKHTPENITGGAN